MSKLPGVRVLRFRGDTKSQDRRASYWFYQNCHKTDSPQPIRKPFSQLTVKPDDILTVYAQAYPITFNQKRRPPSDTSELSTLSEAFHTRSPRAGFEARGEAVYMGPYHSPTFTRLLIRSPDTDFT